MEIYRQSGLFGLLVLMIKGALEPIHNGTGCQSLPWDDAIVRRHGDRLSDRFHTPDSPQIQHGSPLFPPQENRGSQDRHKDNI